MKKKIIIIIITLAIFMCPLNSSSIGTAAPDKTGYIQRTVEYKPLAVVLLDYIFRADIPLVYFRVTKPEFIGIPNFDN